MRSFALLQRAFCLAAGIAVCLLLAGRSACGQALSTEGFDTPDISWQPAGADTAYRLEAHARDPQNPHGGQLSERIRISATGGTAVYFSHEIGPASVIAELAPSLWIRSDRAGLQLLARVVFPRSADPRTGRAVTALLRGPGYTQAGNWQQLRLENVPDLVEQQARVLRTQIGCQLDSREAYIDRLVLNIYGGPGMSEVWIDDLEIGGLVKRQAAPGHVLRSGGKFAFGWARAGGA